MYIKKSHRVSPITIDDLYSQLAEIQTDLATLEDDSLRLEIGKLLRQAIAALVIAKMMKTYYKK